MSGVTMKIDRFGDFKRSIKSLTSNKVLVGWPEQTGERKPEPDEREPLTNAQIAFLMDKGVPELNIPARPSLGPGVESVKQPITDRLHKTAMLALTGDASATKAGLTGVGLIAQSAVRAKITDGPFQALAERTLADRRRRGRTGEKPLIDTGQLRQAVNFVIRGD